MVIMRESGPFSSHSIMDFPWTDSRSPCQMLGIL